MAPPVRSLAPRWVTVLVDVALASAAAVAGTWRELALHQDLLITLPPAAGVAVQVIAGALLLLRRRHPLTSGLCIAALSVLTPTYASAAVPFQAFAFAADRRRAVAVALLATITWGLGAQAWQLDDPWTFLLVHLISAVGGLLARSRVQLADTLFERAERAEREQLLLAERAVTAERMRLAGEMHDLVSHQITLMVLQAAALDVGPGSDAATRAAAQRLQVSGRQALAELRGLVEVLRRSEETEMETSPRALGDGVRDLVATARVAGMTIDLELEDAGVGDPFVVHTALRVVQESLTNAGRHAPGEPVVIRVEQTSTGVGGRTLAMSVSNGHCGRPAAEPGHGLHLMRRRVELLGGRFSVHSSDDRHEVRVALPLSAGSGDDRP